MTTHQTEKGYKPGDKALIQFGDGEWRPAELSRGFIWATPDGSHHLAAEGGFDARPLLATAEFDHKAEPSWIATTRCVRCAQPVARHVSRWRRLWRRLTTPPETVSS